MEPREQLELAGDDAEPPASPYQVLLANEQVTLPIDEAKLIDVVRAVLSTSQFESAVVSLAIVDDPTIHDLNVQYLQHDYPTDVLSFVLEDDGQHLEGQLVVSADTAVSNAVQYNWSATEELLLYVVHGALHLIGFDDKQPDDAAAMREAEAKHLLAFGIAIPEEHRAVSEDVQ